MTPLLAPRLRADRSFERIYRRHLGDVYRYSLAVLRNPSDAEDVTQTTFLNAYRAYQSGDRPRNPHNWLIAIAHNVCRQRFRQSQRRPEEVAYDDRIGDVVPEEEHGPTADDIQRALGQLAFNQRAALVMRELEGRSYAEIAEILGLSTSAVETLIFRARRALREQLDGSLTCVDAERAISLQSDGRLARPDRGALRAHLRECKACERLARSHRAQRTAFKALATIPIPSSLTSLFGGGATVGAGAGAKAAAIAAAGLVATGVTVEGAQRVVRQGERAPAAAPPPAASVASVEAKRVTPVRFAGDEPRVERQAARSRRPSALVPARRAAEPPGQARRPARALAPGQAKKAKPAKAVRVAVSRRTAKARPERKRPVRPNSTPVQRGAPAAGRPNPKAVPVPSHAPKRRPEQKRAKAVRLPPPPVDRPPARVVERP